MKKNYYSSFWRVMKRTLGLSVSNMWRSKLFTLSTLGVISLIVFILNITLGLNIFTSQLLKSVQEKVDIILYLKDDADIIKVKELEDRLKTMEEIKSVRYTSKDQALQKFLSNYSPKDNPFEKYISDNPLPADLTIITSKASDHQKVLNFVKQNEYNNLLSSISESDLINNKISNQVIDFTRNVENFLLWLMSTFAIATIFIIINSIHLTIYSRKNEIEIMKLVGARPIFIKAPFILEGCLYGFLSIIISGFLIILLTSYFNLNTNIQGTPLSLIYSLIINPFYFSIQILLGIIMGFISSWIATSLYFHKNL